MLFWPVYGPTFLISAGQGAVLPIIPLVARDLEASLALAGVIAAFRGFGNNIFDIPAGMIAGRFGEKLSMIFAGVILLISALFAIVAMQLVEFSVVWALVCFSCTIFTLGAASSLWQVARLIFVTQVCPENQRGRGISLVGGFTRAGRFVGPLLAAICYGFYGLESAFLIFAIFIFLSLILVVRYVRNTGTADESESSSIAEVVTVLKNYRTVFGRVGIAVVLLAVARHSRDIFWPLWGSEIGLSAQEISVIMGLAYAVDTVPFYFAGIVMDKFGRKAAAVPCLLILSFTAFALVFTDTFLGMLIICLISGFGNGLGSGIVMTIGADLSPIRGRGEFLGAWRLIADTGQSGGQLMLGPIAALTSLGIAIGGVGVLGLCGVIAFIFIAPEPQVFHKSKSHE